MRINIIIKGVLFVIFLYIAFFSIQNFWQGYHDVDLSFNFLNLGYSVDRETSGQFTMLNETYLRGLNQMKNGFIWLCIDCIFAVMIGYWHRLFNKNNN